MVNTKLRYGALGGCLFMLALLAGCAVDRVDEAYVRDGVAYGVTEGPFRGRWWSYYERGLSYMAGGFYAEAVQDFQVALQGNSRDSWQARTYGLHFTAYFPNRELGIALLELERLEEAEEYLLHSIAAVDTERAYHYLDQTKRALIARGDLPADTTPQLRTNADGQLLLSDRALDLSIEAEDLVGVAHCEINGRRLYQRGSAAQIRTSDQLLLQEGSQALAVTAVNLAGNRSTEQIEVTVDLTGPNLGIHHPLPGAVVAADSLALEGVAVDHHGMAQVFLDDQQIALGHGETRIDFTTSLPLEPGENRFVLRALDQAGNETRSAITVYRGDPDSLSARLWQRKERRPAGMHLAQTGDDAGSAVDLLLSADAEEAVQPGIELRSPRPDRPYRHNRTLRVSGEVISTESIVALSINDEPFESLTGAPRESFNRRLPLDIEGEAELSLQIRAEDAAGNVVSESVQVPVRPVHLETQESRMPVAVLAFSGHGIDEELSAYLRTTTESQLFQQRRFRVLERMQLEDVLTEQQLASALADPNEAIALGRLTPSHVFIVTEVFSHGASGLELKTRVISTESSEIMETLDVFVEDKDDTDALRQACDDLATQLAQAFPRLSAEVLGVRGRGNNQDILIDLTREDGVKEGAYMLVVYEEEPWIDEMTGEVLAPGDYIAIGRARITAVTPSNVRAQTVEAEEGSSIEAGLPAITM